MLEKKNLALYSNTFLKNQWTFGEIRGSHNYRIYHPYFKNFPDEFGSEGFMTIPVSRSNS